jgi:hypothetical protein
MKRFGSGLMVLVASTALGPASIAAQDRGRARSVGPYTPPPTASAKVDENKPPRIAEFGTIASPVTLRPAAVEAPDRLDAMEAWNRAGNEPPRAGFTRSLPDVISARFGAAANADSHSVRARSAAGVTFWGTKVIVGDAYGIRLHLTGVAVPPGTKFWSYGTEGRPVSFGLELLGPGGDLWTPITFGETAYLDVEVPSSSSEGRLSIPEVAEIRPLAAPTEPPCAIDAACVSAETFPAIAEARKAVALVQFMIGNVAAWCTGTLLNDTAQDGMPYLLTAHHCISDQPTASSLQAFWDYDAPTCGGTVPALSSLESSVGATLLATGASSDFCLMQLSSVPSSRSFLGWDARPSPVESGTTLYRLSHPTSYLGVEPSPLPMEFSESVSDPSTSPCSGLGPDYVFSRLSAGFAYYGSSGSALLLKGGQVVGQLKGPCAAIIEICAAPPDLFDGAFSMSYPFVARWLDAPSPACVPDPTRLCLGSRFQVTAQWNKADGTSGSGTAVSLTPDSGYFWFFDPSNVEIITKVVNGCGINAHYWAFASGLTNTGVTLSYIDLAGAVQQTYRSAAGTAFEPIQDTAAFSTCP